MSRVTFGPLVGVQNSEGYFLAVPFQTNGDWFGTPDGRSVLENVISNFQGDIHGLPKGTLYDWKNDDRVVVLIPCSNSLQASALATSLKNKIPKVTEAILSDTIRFSIQP